jgi:hypothetical protein
MGKEKIINPFSFDLAFLKTRQNVSLSLINETKNRITKQTSKHKV